VVVSGHRFEKTVPLRANDVYLFELKRWARRGGSVRGFSKASHSKAFSGR